MNDVLIPFHSEYMDMLGFKPYSKKVSQERAKNYEHLCCKDCGSYYNLRKVDNGEYICKGCLTKQKEEGESVVQD